MPLKLAYRGGAMLRTVRLNVFSHRARVAALHTPSRRVSLASTGRFPNALAGIVYPSAIQTGKSSNSYATTARGSKTTSKKTSKTTKASKGKEPAKRGPKVSADKIKAQKEARKQKEKIDQLRTAALKLPELSLVNTRALAMQEKAQEVKKAGGKGQEVFKRATELVGSMGPEEVERFKSIAQSNKAANAEELDKWIKSHTPLQIKHANLARRRLSQLQGKRIAPLHDDRAVKRRGTAFVFFFLNRFASGDFKHMHVSEATGQASREWKGMTEEEKEKYRKQAAEDTDRYLREYRAVYGEDPYSVAKSKAKAKA
ncbi:HMG box protein [Aspergillus sp. HF37]|nr:HMG box protein [Aspergillus sp. HF37]